MLRKMLSCLPVMLLTLSLLPLSMFAQDGSASPTTSRKPCRNA
jgi:hypothetical protein